jgi:hypothetical protein
MGFVVSFAPWPGLTSALDGVAREFVTLPAAGSCDRLDARLNVASTSDVTVTVSDGTTSVVLTIPAGNLHASAAVSGAFPTLATLTVQTDGASVGAQGFSGSAWFNLSSSMPAGSGSGIVTLADVKGALGITGATTEQDAWLERQIDVFSSKIRLYCNRHFNVRRIVQVFDHPELVVTADAPITTIHTATASGQSIDPATLRVDADAGLISPPQEQGSPGWNEYHPLEIDFEAGFATVPADVAELIYTGIAKRWGAFQAGAYAPEARGVVKRETVADAGTLEYATPSSTMRYEAADYLLGLPLAQLDPWIRPLHVGASEIMAWAEVQP